MICINSDVLLQNSMDLNSYVDVLKKECTDQKSEKVMDCVIDFLFDLWDRVDKIKQMIQKYISGDLIPVACIEIEETSDLSKVEIKAYSPNSTIKVKKKDIYAFNEFCEKGMKGFTPLYERLFYLDI